MQSKIIDFASDAITKQLRKIEKDDVKKIMANVTGSKSPQNSSIKVDDKSAHKVTSSEEYCAMMKNEFALNIEGKQGEGPKEKKSDLNQPPQYQPEKEELLKKNGRIKPL